MMSKHRAAPAPSSRREARQQETRPRETRSGTGPGRMVFIGILAVAVALGVVVVTVPRVRTLADQVLNRIPADPTASARGDVPAGAAAAVSSNGLTMTNLDGLTAWPMPDQLVFNRIQFPADDHEAVHDTGTTRLANPGHKNIRVAGLSLTGPYELVSAPTLPATVKPGAHLDVTIRFNAGSGGSTGSVEAGSLQVRTNLASTSIALEGWWQNVSEHAMEPSVADLKDMFGLNVTLPARFYTRGEVKAYSSDEVLSPYWQQLDAGKPVTIQEIASFYTYGVASHLTWFTEGTKEQQPWASTGQYQSQTVLPRTASTSTPDALSSGSIDPDGAFGFKVDDQSSDPAQNNQAADRAAGCTTKLCGNYVRAFQLHDADGSVLRGSYLITEDDGGAKPNYDYNDHVYIISNVKPA